MHSGLELAKKLQEAVLKCACWKPNASDCTFCFLPV